MAINYRGTSVARNLGMVAPVRTFGSVTAGNVAVFEDATGRRIKDGGTAVRQQDFSAVPDLTEEPTYDEVVLALRSTLAVLKGAATIALAMLALVAGAQTSRLGSLRAGDVVVTNEQDGLAYPVATNALALASTALQPAATNGLLRAEADTLATVTARGATTTSAITIGSRGAGAVGQRSFAHGDNVIASGYASHAEGGGTTASGDYSHAEGTSTTASGDYSHAEGSGTTASGYYSHAEGSGTTASGHYSHASGFMSVASHEASFAWQGSDGGYSESPYESHGPGTFNLNPVGGLAGLWIGETTLDALLGERATWQGATNIAAAAVAASGHLPASATNGLLRAEADTLATVTARGATTTSAITIGSRGAGAVGVSSFANGENVVASGRFSHAEGGGTTASGRFSHAEGSGTTASEYYSHAEGGGTTASEYYSHAEGSYTTASGDISHASGFNSVASNITAFAWQGSDGGYSESPYGSHGPGTYNLNPVGGLAGFWIGETTLASLLNAKATYLAATNIAAAAVAASGHAMAEQVVSGAVCTASAGNRYFWTSATNVVLSVNLTSGQVVNLAKLNNTATNSITAIGPVGWEWTGGDVTNTIAAGKSMTFGFLIDAATGKTNAYATGVSK